MTKAVATVSEKTSLPESQMKVLEAMSLIYEICMKKNEYKISTDSNFYKQVLRTYNDLQNLRDDSIYQPVEADLNEKFLKELKSKRIKELTEPPFGAAKESWMK
jgi:hypothetical protein